MFQTLSQKSTGGWTLILIFALLILPLIPVSGGEPGGGDSPQAVFKAAQEAGAKKDFSTLVQLVAPSERPMLAFGADMGVGMFVEFYEGEKAAELKKQYQKIQDKYGVKTGDKEEEEGEGEQLQITGETSQEAIDAHMRKRAEKLYGHVDAVKYIPELLAVLASMPEMAEQPLFPQVELSGLKVDGDRATGMAGEKSISFMREKDRWYLTADVMN